MKCVYLYICLSIYFSTYLNMSQFACKYHYNIAFYGSEYLTCKSTL